MNTKDYTTIAMSIWRSGYIKDKNKIRQQARERMRRLITSDLVGSFRGAKDFDEKKFYEDCGFEYSL